MLMKDCKYMQSMANRVLEKIDHEHVLDQLTTGLDSNAKQVCNTRRWQQKRRFLKKEMWTAGWQQRSTRWT